MVHDDNARQGFSLRLRQAIAWAGWPERGAQARLANLAGTTAKAANKWFNGEAVPRRGKLKIIADELGVQPAWLEYGVSPGPADTEAASAQQRGGALAALDNLKGKVTPRSQAAIDRIEKAATSGKLSEADLVLLEEIAARFEDKPADNH